VRAKEFLENFRYVAEAPNGVDKLREMILSLAMQGALVPQNASDIAADQLLQDIEAEKRVLREQGSRNGARKHADLSATEIPHLLDPIKKTDVDLLAFDEEGNAIPTPEADNWERERVNESIKRLKLNDHDALPQERRRVWQRVSEESDAYLDAKSKYRPGINPAPAATIEEKARRIWEMTREDAELSAVAIWCLRFRNDPGLLKLVA
jgi:hypothetical protein